jgi:hypothetical protein
VLGRPFIGSEGEQGSQTGRGIGRQVVGRHYGPSGSVGRGNGRGEWGVKSAGVRHRFRERRGRRGGARMQEAVAVTAIGWLRPGE